MTKTVIVAGARTPFGKFGGALAPLTAAQLGGIAIKEAVKRAEIEGKDVQEVIIGNVLQGGQGQLPIQTGNARSRTSLGNENGNDQ